MTDVPDTEGLILRPLKLEDAARTQEFFPDWEGVKFLNEIVPWPYLEDAALFF